MSYLSAGELSTTGEEIGGGVGDGVVAKWWPDGGAKDAEHGWAACCPILA